MYWRNETRAIEPQGLTLKNFMAVLAEDMGACQYNEYLKVQVWGHVSNSFSTAVLYLSVPDYEAFLPVMAEFQFFKLSMRG